MRKFEGFQRDRQAILDNPRLLAISAKLRGISEEEYILRSINSFRINKAFENYYLYQNGNLDKALWDRYEKDIYRLFSDQSVIAHWVEVKELFSPDFQIFIERHIHRNSTAKPNPR